MLDAEASGVKGKDGVQQGLNYRHRSLYSQQLGDTMITNAKRASWMSWRDMLGANVVKTETLGKGMAERN